MNKFNITVDFLSETVRERIEWSKYIYRYIYIDLKNAHIYWNHPSKMERNIFLIKTKTEGIYC